ncbi:MAG: 2OG-Fe(II) oxygenase [Rhodospirillaceae bacterium]
MSAAVKDRLNALDWPALRHALDETGHARTGPLLSAADCAALIAGYDSQPNWFRKEVVMARHGYGAGAYRYFADPLPDLVQTLRAELYSGLAPLAQNWKTRLREDGPDYPEHLEDWLALCHHAGQTKPTPLLLRYGPGDYNRLHQDLYGALVFPVQLAVLLNKPDQDFTGGAFVLTEQRARMQSRPRVVPLQQGEGVLFAVSHRPGRGPRGDHRLTQRHGVSDVVTGQRHVLGVIFHDAA